MIIDTKIALEKKLKEISEILDREVENNKQIGVLSGITGIALFNFYYSKYLDIDDHADKGVELLNESVNRINEGYQFPTFCTGIAGAAWVFDHLAEEDFMEAENDELLSELDEFLYAVMENDMKTGNYDFLHAAVGYGYYFIKRLRNTQSDELKKRYETFLSNFLDMLKDSATEDPNGLKWESTLDIETGLRGYNLSLSHGLSSIIIFLAKLMQFDALKEKTTPLLDGALSYLLSNEYKSETRPVHFPSWVMLDEEEAKEGSSRLAWCYGDIGPGLALLHTSEALNREDLKEKALNILRFSAKRTQPDDTGVRDAGVCHGSYGNAQIFNRLYKKTGEEIFKNAASFWIDHGLETAIHEDGFAGYKQWRGKDEEWLPENNLLEGIAGIGLAIIDYLADFDTKWDECLMIS